MVKCDRSEVLRYLGYRGQEMSEETVALIEEIACEAEKSILTRYCTLKTDAEQTDEGIFLKECGVAFEGEDIKKHLTGCKKVILLAATLGVELERKIRAYEVSDITKALVLDACGSAMIESYLNEICEGIGNRLKENGLYLTSRFSPGYGDLPLSSQKDFLRAVNAERKAGITCNENFLLSPGKSVTAIIGITGNKPRECLNVSCDICNMAYNCPYKKRVD